MYSQKKDLSIFIPIFQEAIVLGVRDVFGRTLVEPGTTACYLEISPGED
jgi:hypothetical protein